MDSFGVKRCPCSSGAAAEKDESSASTDVVDALFPDFDLAGAFDDDVVAEAFGLEVVDVYGFGSELFTDGEARWVSASEGYMVDADLFEGGDEEQTDCSRADDENSKALVETFGGAEPKLHFADGLGDTGVRLKEGGDIERDVVRLGVDVLFDDPFGNEEVFGEGAENLGGHDRLTEVFLASAAPEAVSAGGGVDAHHGVSDAEFRTIAGGDDGSGVFVTEDSGHGNLGMTAAIGFEVGTAGRGGFDSYKDVAGVDGWDCYGAKGQNSGSFEDHRPHLGGHALGFGHFLYQRLHYGSYVKSRQRVDTSKSRLGAVNIV